MNLSIPKFSVTWSSRVAFASFVAAVFALLAWPLAAQHTPSKPFLEKTAFYLRSAGFNIRFANENPAGERALKMLPPHRFVIHKFGSTPRYVYADPGVCNCIFTGTRDNYESYLSILRQPIPGVADVSPDYKTEASALLMEQPIDFGMTNDDDSLADYFRDYL
ncbi:MAG: hypothetical protein ACRC9K_09245 [Afipia sp.]